MDNDPMLPMIADLIDTDLLSYDVCTGVPATRYSA